VVTGRHTSDGLWPPRSAGSTLPIDGKKRQIPVPTSWPRRPFCPADPAYSRTTLTRKRVTSSKSAGYMVAPNCPSKEPQPFLVTALTARRGGGIAAIRLGGCLRLAQAGAGSSRESHTAAASAFACGFGRQVASGARPSVHPWSRRRRVTMSQRSGDPPWRGTHHLRPAHCGSNAEHPGSAAGPRRRERGTIRQTRWHRACRNGIVWRSWRPTVACRHQVPGPPQEWETP